MFKKYIFNSLKKHPVEYAVIALCELALLVISLFSTVVMMNNISEGENAIERAKRFNYYFVDLNGVNVANPENAERIEQAEAKLHEIGKIRERILRFCEICPVEIERLEVELRGTGYYHEVLMFPTYDDLVYFYTKKLSLSRDIIPTEEQYLNHEKVAIAGMSPFHSNYVYTDSSHILFGGEEYLVLGENPNRISFEILFGSEPNNIKVSAIDVFVKDFVSNEQSEEIDNLFKEIVIPDFEYIENYPPKVNGLLEIRKRTSIIVMTALMLIVSSFNIMVIFKYLIDKRKGEYAVFRLCGYGQTNAMLFPFLETLSVSSICAVLSCVVFHLLKPLISDIYPIVSVLFDFSFFTVFTLSFIGITAVLFMIYIVPSLNKSVSDELREM